MKLFRLALGIGLGSVVLQRLLKNRPSGAPSGGGQRDVVDQASEDSFPASDAPSYTGMSTR